MKVTAIISLVCGILLYMAAAASFSIPKKVYHDVKAEFSIPEEEIQTQVKAEITRSVEGWYNGWVSTNGYVPSIYISSVINKTDASVRKRLAVKDYQREITYESRPWKGEAALGTFALLLAVIFGFLDSRLYKNLNKLLITRNSTHVKEVEKFKAYIKKQEQLDKLVREK